MNEILQPGDAIARIPVLKDGRVQIDVLSGGLTNRTFKVTHRDDVYVLRLDAEYTPAFGLDRRRELEIAGNAAAVGIAPQIVFADIRDGILLTRFVEGHVWSVDDLGITQNVARLGRLLRRVHALPLSGQPFDAMRIARRYLEWLDSSPELKRTGAGLIDSIRAASQPRELRCCHNDVVAANIIDNGRLVLIDWEYASDNDPLFDLASLVAYHDLGDDTRDALLDACLGGASREDRAWLQAQIRLYDALHWLWLAVRQSNSPAPHQAEQLATLQRKLL